MAEVEVFSVGGNGSAVAGQVKNDDIATGAGMWRSVQEPGYGWVWYPALVPKTIQMNNPQRDSIHKIIDAIVRDPKTNKPVLHEDPAAQAAVREHWKGQDVKHKWIPVMAFNEAKEPIREAVSDLKTIVAEQSKMVAQAMENQTKLLALVLSGKVPTPVPADPAPAAPKRRGRPPNSVQGA